MATQLTFEGVYPILATPFDDNENLDLESFDRLVRFMAGLGVDGITVLGVLGEANRLLDRERAELIRTAVAAAGAMPVIVGASHSGTRAATELAQMAENLGARAVMVTPHAETVPNDDRVFEYYRSIAEGIRIPIVAHQGGSRADRTENPRTGRRHEGTQGADPGRTRCTVRTV